MLPVGPRLAARPGAKGGSGVQHEHIRHRTRNAWREAPVGRPFVVGENRIVVIGSSLENSRDACSADALLAGEGYVDSVVEKHIENGPIRRNLQNSL